MNANDITTPAGRLLLAALVVADMLNDIGLETNQRARFIQIKCELNMLKDEGSSMAEGHGKALYRETWKGLAKALADETEAYEQQQAERVERIDSGAACPFCRGTGHQPWNQHILDGICFRCNGEG